MKMIKDISSEWQHFGAGMAFTVVLPLVPLVVVSWCAGGVTAQSLTLATAIYAATIGLNSKQVVPIAIALFVSLSFAAAFGRIVGTGVIPDGCSAAAWLSLVAITVIHVCELFIKHVGRGESFIQTADSE